MISVTQPRLLIVAGHDPSGGAGIEADRESVSDLAIDPLFVVTAFTDQDASCVRSIGAREPEAWLGEALELVGDGVLGVKFGLLPGAEHVRTAARLLCMLQERSTKPFSTVVDPVIASSSGTRFMYGEAIDAVRLELVLLGIVLTPNLPEAAELARQPLDDLIRHPERRIEAAEYLLALGARAVVIKGGHGAEDPIRDLVAAADGTVSWHEHPRVAGGKIRGSGCRYASRLAAGLALGRSLEESAHEAGTYVARLIRERRGG